MNTCETCRFWSDRIAGNCDTGMEALCLNEDSPFYSTFVTENSWCPKWDYNAWGAIDELGAPDDYDDDPEEKTKGSPDEGPGPIPAYQRRCHRRLWRYR